MIGCCSFGFVYIEEICPFALSCSRVTHMYHVCTRLTVSSRCHDIATVFEIIADRFELNAVSRKRD